jgi:DNA helicase HerA-like ATPase
MPAGHLGILAVRELKIRQRRSIVSQENEMLAITAIIRVKKGCETAMREALRDITPAVREQWFVVDDAGRADHRRRQTPAYSHLFFAPGWYSPQDRRFGQ